MQRRVGSLELVATCALVLAVACATPLPPTPSAGLTPAASPSPVANASLLDDLSSIALQPRDLDAIPGTFSAFDVGRTLQLDALPAPQDAADRFGRLGGWKARYSQGPEVTAGVLVVDSRIDLFPSADAAAADLQAYSDRYSAQANQPGATLSNPAVGDGATLLAIVPSDPTHVSTASLAWRSGPFTGQVVTSGLGEVDVAAAAVALAMAVAARMSAAVAGG